MSFLGEIGVTINNKHIIYDYTSKEDVVDVDA